MTQTEIEQLATATASRHKLDPVLVHAIISVESAWNTWAVRFEPGYRYFFHVLDFADALHLSTGTEEASQRTSWGLMQIMGAVARERGFASHLPQLCDPALGIEYGCRHLVWLRQYAQEESDLVAMYNGGRGALKKTTAGMYSNQQYVNKVHARLVALRALPS